MDNTCQTLLSWEGRKTACARRCCRGKEERQHVQDAVVLGSKKGKVGKGTLAFRQRADGGVEGRTRTVRELTVLLTVLMGVLRDRR